MLPEAKFVRKIIFAMILLEIFTNSDILFYISQKIEEACIDRQDLCPFGR